MRGSVTLGRDNPSLIQAELEENTQMDVVASCSAGQIESSGWKRSPQNHSADLNLCTDGKMIPSLYVLGAAKSATTSMAQELVAAGARCAGDRKEYHFFKHSNLLQYKEDSDAIRKKWLAGMPPCDTESRTLLGDFSPQSFRLVANPTQDDSAERLPETLRSIYGPTMYKQITFVVLLREPLARAQSWFYYGHVPSTVFQASMEDQLSLAANGWAGNPSSSAVWGSYYGHHLGEWLKSFDASQFLIVPFKAFTSGDSSGICQDLSQRLSFNMECGTMTTHRLAFGARHPSVEDDTTAEFRQKWGEFFDPDKELLVNLLAQGHTQGMGLAAYSGKAGDVEDVQKWLEQSW